jgi:hypothetical protein
VDCHRGFTWIQPISLCVVDDCSNRHKARGYCVMHYSRWRRGRPIDSREVLDAS